MPDTPRLVVGSATFHVLGMSTAACASAVLLEVRALPGVASASADTATGTLLVIAAFPVDRSEVVAAARRVGHSVTQ